MRVLALDIGVQIDIRHGRQQLRQLAARWAQQRRRQDRPQLGFLAAAMGPGSLLEGLHEGNIDAAHQQVSDSVIPLLIAMLSTFCGLFPDSGMVGSAGFGPVAAPHLAPIVIATLSAGSSAATSPFRKAEGLDPAVTKALQAFSNCDSA